MRRLFSIALIAALIISMTPVWGINIGISDSGIVFAYTIPIDEEHFPDENFRGALTEWYGTSIEPSSIGSLSVRGLSIESLEGIQYFDHMETLQCGSNNLSSLDLTHNTALKYLDCENNKLENLDVSKNNALSTLYCSQNNLSSLDVSNNTALTGFDCSSNNLNSLDVSNNTALGHLYCSNNNLSSLDVSHNTVLTALNCSYNNLSSLDVSHNTALEHLSCGDNKLSSLNIRHNPALFYLDCWNNNFGKIYVRENPPATFYHDDEARIIYPGSETVEIQPETGDDISDMAYLAMADMAYLDVDKKNLKGAGALNAEKLYELGSTKSDSDITMWGDTVVNDIDPDYGFTWGDLYKQCLQGWEIVDYHRDDNGFFAVTFKKDNNVVVSYRGSDGVGSWNNIKWENIFTDWLVDDNYSAFIKQASPQMIEAIKYAKKTRKDYNEKTLSFTGHSLGGGLAILASMYTGEKAVPFDSAPTVEVGYYVLSEIMARSFHGIDKWNFIDRVNEDCPVGNYETGKLLGLEKWGPKKNYVAHQNMYTGANIVAPHSRESILTFDEEKMQFALSPVTDSKIFGTSDPYAVSVRQVDEWIAILGPACGLIKDIAEPKGTLRLGTSFKDVSVATKKGLLPDADVIYGGDNIDEIGSFEGPDTLIGGHGADILDGGHGNDTYIYYNGDDYDSIYDYSGNDTLELIGFSSGSEITVDGEDESYFKVKVDGDTIARISKNRSNNPINSFVIKIFDANYKAINDPIKIQNFNTWKKYNTYKIGCPVSVEILDPDGQVVNTISDGVENMLHTDYANMYCALNEETGEYEKYIILKYGYTIRIIGEGDGAMDISVRECEEGKEDELYTASDLPVSTGEVYTVDTESQSVSTETGDIYDLTEEKEEHTFSYYVSNGDATCLKDGTKTAICDSCDATDTIPDEGSATGHSFSAWKTTKKATELAAGQQSRICSVCGETETNTIAQLAPTLPAVKISKPNAAKKAATIKWKNISKKNLKKIKKVEIQCSTDKNFTNDVKTKYAGAKKTSYKIKGLKKGKKYYVRIRAYTSTGGVVHVSKWSATKPVKVK